MFYKRERNESKISMGLAWGQRLRFPASTAGGIGSIPGQVTKILHTTCCDQKKKKKSIREKNL